MVIEHWGEIWRKLFRLGTAARRRRKLTDTPSYGSLSSCSVGTLQFCPIGSQGGCWSGRRNMINLSVYLYIPLLTYCCANFPLLLQKKNFKYRSRCVNKVWACLHSHPTILYCYCTVWTIVLTGYNTEKVWEFFWWFKIGFKYILPVLLSWLISILNDY